MLREQEILQCKESYFSRYIEDQTDSKVVQRLHDACCLLKNKLTMELTRFVINQETNALEVWNCGRFFRIRQDGLNFSQISSRTVLSNQSVIFLSLIRYIIIHYWNFKVKTRIILKNVISSVCTCFCLILSDDSNLTFDQICASF